MTRRRLPPSHVKRDFTAERYKYADNNGITRDITFDKIVLFGDETAQLFADPTQKPKPYAANGMLTERWQKKSTKLFGMIQVYHRHKSLEKISYQDIASIRYILDPAQREQALQEVLTRAKEGKVPKLVKYAEKAGLIYKINAPLDALAGKMAARHEVKFLQNKMAVADKKKIKTDKVALQQFSEVTAKIGKLKSSGVRRALYLQIADIHPVAAQAAILRTQANGEKPAPKKPAAQSVALGKGTAKLYVLLKKNSKRVHTLGKMEAAYDTDVLLGFDSVVEQTALLKDDVAKSKVFERLALIHPVAEDAEIYMDRAWDIAANLPNGTVKAKRFQSLRDHASDKETRLAAHDLFIRNAAFTQAVTDAAELKEKRFENYVDLIKISHEKIVAEKGTSLAHKSVYQQHVRKISHNTLGYQLKW